jgi:hypothetical protein
LFCLDKKVVSSIFVRNDMDIIPTDRRQYATFNRAVGALDPGLHLPTLGSHVDVVDWKHVLKLSRIVLNGRRM